ncbi:polyphosphate kinase 2 [Marisediminicola senii]|uniref:polyphosphate kinase 2 n=1 Tax=Marisediminicola senii TaxID=2711233 RepID=UPI0013EBDBC8|nr:polyphosphate kinase 2 [Marisediminicola senii]
MSKTKGKKSGTQGPAEQDPKLQAPPKRVPKKPYESELERLQVELVTMQRWVVDTGARLVVIFEGRDAAGKGGAIKRIMQYLNPRSARVVALPTPSEREKGQWYFQRYVEHLPTKGEIVLMDRSWYNRAGVERVMEYCTAEQYQLFLQQAPLFEKMLVDDGIILIKYWFSVSDDVQEQRFHSRLGDPMRRWKLSDTDVLSISRWEDYSRAKDAMFEATDTVDAPWWTIESDDKRSSRLNAINHLLSQVPYEHRDPDEIQIPARPKSSDYERPAKELHKHVPDHAGSLAEK